jgi:hypothetical protein
MARNAYPRSAVIINIGSQNLGEEKKVGILFSTSLLDVGL